VVTQDLNTRSGRRLPMYEKVKQAGAPRCVVVATGGGVPLAGGDTWWDDFVGSNEAWLPEICAAGSHTNILFSSGTTGEPKAIPWTHLTPIKAAADGHFHHDIHSGDVVAWPTNLGWMMGPWLIYASLVNDATMALYDEAPTGREFGEFVRDAGVTVLGLVPSIVAAWRTTGCMDGIDLTGLRLLSSTGEASNPDDMAWLMGLVGNKPVIEYCGGTEIGGGYITGTVVQPAVPSCFSTPALGIALVVLDEGGRRAGEGEVYIVPPSIGLSTELINRDHDEVYHDGVPDIGIPLRRHGDRMEALAGGYYRAKGRVDDTMNLGGIKVAAADIERAVAGIDGLTETAAIAVPPPGGGPDRLVLYAVTEGPIDPDRLRADMQRRIRDVLNPLFRIHEVVVVDSLPRTASAKVMRRRLRAGYGDR
jgi:acetyl-CoA synthetase